MRPALPALVVLLVAAPLLAPHAEAHVVPRAGLLQRVDHDTVVSVELLTDLPTAGSEPEMLVEVVNFTTAAHPLAVPRLRLHAPGETDAGREVPLEAEARGHFRGRAPLDATGEWHVQVTVPETGAEVRIPLTVYPAAPHRFRWAPDATEHFETGAPARLAFLVVNATGAPQEAPETGLLRWERWTHDWNEKLAEGTVPLAALDVPGALGTEHAFDTPGLYALHVGAPPLGLHPGDRPPFQVYVFPATEEPPTGDEAPERRAAGAGAIASGLVALLGAGLLQRRGRQP